MKPDKIRIRSQLDINKLVYAQMRRSEPAIADQLDKRLRSAVKFGKFEAVVRLLGAVPMCILTRMSRLSRLSDLATWR